MFTSPWSHRPLTKVLTGVVLSLVWGSAVVVSVMGAAPASAHAALVKITPAPGAKLATAPTSVVLEFDEPVSGAFATVVVSTASGVSVTRGKPTVLGARLTQPLSPALAKGRYRVAYRVVSDDGHPISGESDFTLTAASGTGSSTSVGSPSASDSHTSAAHPVPTLAGPSSTSPGPGPRAWSSRFLVPISGAVAVLAGSIGVFLWNRQRR